MYTQFDFSIHVMNVSGSGNHVIAEDAGWPDWAPTGDIVFEGHDDDLGADAVRVMHDDGSNAHTVLTDAVLPAWSPDGTTIAASESNDGDEGGTHLALIDADGSNHRTLTDLSSDYMLDPRSRPTGTRLAYSTNKAIVTMNVDGSDRRMIAGNGPNRHGFLQPKWQPHGAAPAAPASVTPRGGKDLWS